MGMTKMCSSCLNVCDKVPCPHLMHSSLHRKIMNMQQYVSELKGGEDNPEFGPGESADAVVSKSFFRP